MVLPSLLAVQSHPRYWSPDPTAWRPSRWIVSSPDPSNDFEGETFCTPLKGGDIPWSDGGRACPGKKFTQVEFVAAMAALFRDHYVEPLVEHGESMERARKRMEEVVADSGMVLLLQMLGEKGQGFVGKGYSLAVGADFSSVEALKASLLCIKCVTFVDTWV